MIPYSDLVSALRSWRERNGLPNFGHDPGPPSAGIVKAPPGPPGPPAGFGLATRTAPSAPPPPPPGSISTLDVEDEIEASEIESEEIYENEGNDFAMAFGGSPAVQVATEPAAMPDKFPAGGGYTDPGVTEPEHDGGGGGGGEFGTMTFDDDFAAEAAPATGGTRPGVAVGKDADTADEAVATDDEPAPAKGAGKKKKGKR